MKKTVLLLMATFMFAYITTNGQELKNPYVDYKTPPTGLTAEQKIANFKLAIEGKEVPGAKLNADPSDYKMTWGDQLYNAVLAASNSSFRIGKSIGGEKNWGIAISGIAGPTGGVLPAGVETIWFGDIEIAKIGTNYCYNALPPFKVNSGDPDEVAYVPPAVKTASSTTGTTPLGTGNNITLTVNGTSQNQTPELSFRAGKAILDEGRMDYRMALYDAMTFEQMQAKILIEMQNSKQCCGQTAPAPTNLAPTNMYLAAAPANVDVNVKENVPFGQTFFGQALANTFGHVAGTYLVRGIDRLTGRSVVYRYRNDGVLLNAYPSQGSNQLDYTNTGSVNDNWDNQWGRTAVVGGNPTIRPPGF